MIALLVVALLVPSVAPAAEASSGGGTVIDLSGETVGAQPRAFSAITGNWVVATDGDKKVLAVDGRTWKEGQASAGVADFPLAVATTIDDFKGGEIRVRFKPLSGRTDQGAGIAFNLKPNGDYLTIRANALENNLVLFAVNHGKRKSVEWVRNTPTASQQWHELRVTVSGTEVTGYLDGRKYLTHKLSEPVSGRVGLWSKADSYVLFDQFEVSAAR